MQTGSFEIFPETYSATADLLKTYQVWNTRGGVPMYAAHSLGAIGVVVTEALDILVHTLAAAVKTAVWVPTTVVWLGTFCTIADSAEGANLPAILSHVGRAFGNLLAAPFVILATFTHTSTALNILDTMHLAPGVAGKKELAFAPAFWAQKSVKSKVSFLWSHKKEAVDSAITALRSDRLTAKIKKNRAISAALVATLTLVSSQILQECFREKGSYVRSFFASA